MAIAQATKNDSAAMKTIAALTMIFLPATAVSSFFGMAFFNSQNDKLTVTHDWWLFLATTLPITIVLFLTWAMWPSILRAGRTLLKAEGWSMGKLRGRYTRKLNADNSEPKLELESGTGSRRPSLRKLLSRRSTWWSSDEKKPTQMV